MSLVLGLGLERSCPWPREVLSSKRLSLALALASDFFCVLGLGLGLEPCVLDSTSVTNTVSSAKRFTLKFVVWTKSLMYISGSQPGCRGTLGCHLRFAGVPRAIAHCFITKERMSMTVYGWNSIYDWVN